MPLYAFADSIAFEPSTTEYTFGETRVVRVLERADGWGFRIDIYRESNLLARYPDQYFEVIAASENNEFFVGISNRGLPDTAMIVFNKRGELIRLRTHNGGIEYCRQSISLVREWFDPEDPALSFVETETKIDVVWRGCDGEMQSHTLFKMVE